MAINHFDDIYLFIYVLLGETGNCKHNFHLFHV